MKEEDIKRLQLSRMVLDKENEEHLLTAFTIFCYSIFSTLHESCFDGLPFPSADSISLLLIFLVVEPDYLPDSNIFAFNCVYTL
jgi:hypothetical protein